MSEERDDDDFVVIDKRAASGANASPETGASSAEEPRRASDRGAGSPSPDATSATSRGTASPAPADFAMLVQPFFVAALYHMGLAADPDTGKPGTRNLPLARHNIEILEVIEEKARGNLDDAERQLLEGVLYELRMSFVKVGKVPGE